MCWCIHEAARGIRVSRWLNDLGNAEGFIDPGAIGCKVDHIRYDVKVREDRRENKGKIIIGRHEDLLARVPGVLATRTLSIHAGRAHLRPDEVVLV